MRKWIVGLLIFLVAALAGIYLFIPNKLSFKKETAITFPAKAFSRAFLSQPTWTHWWPGKVTEKRAGTTFLYNGNEYRVVDQKTSSLLVSIKKEADSILTELFVIPVTADSIELEWLGIAPPTTNLFSRIPSYLWMQSLTKDINILLEKISHHYTNPDNLYTLPIREEQVVDSTLISTADILPHYPDADVIYSLLEKLKGHIQKHSAKQTGLPMLNISANADSSYIVRVALPVDKKLPNEGDIQYRWMLGGGNILVTEVKGGPHRIQQAFSQMEQYIDDFQRVAPAIPFQSLVTDRRAEKDTSQWVTKVYWPVM